MNKEKKALTVIDQREVLGNDFQMYGSFEEPLFLAKDVAVWIDYAYKDKAKGRRNINMMLNSVDEDEKLIKTIFVNTIPSKGKIVSPATNGQNRDMWFLTEEGVQQVIQFSRKLSVEKKEQLLQALFPSNTIKYVKGCAELAFLDMLEDILTPMGLTLVKQFNVLGARLDGYIPELNIAVEYDERHHSNQKQADEVRMDKIKSKIGCTFVRVSIRNNNNFNIGIVMNAILMNSRTSK